MRLTIERVVGHTADSLFAVISEPLGRPLWRQGTSDVEMLTPGPTAVGTRWRETSRSVGRIQAEVVGLEPNALWQEAGLADAGEVRITIRLDPEGEGATRVGVEVEIHLHGARRMFESALGPIVSGQMTNDLLQLEALLDADRERLLPQPE